MCSQLTASPPGINQGLSSLLLGEPGAVGDAFCWHLHQDCHLPFMARRVFLRHAVGTEGGTYTIPNQIITAWDDSMCSAQIWRIWLLKGTIGDTYLHQLFNLRIPGRVLIGVATASAGKLPSHPLRNQQAVLLAGAAVTRTAS